ncbi:MAG TPA: hypothetical protein VF320_06610, partial [Acidimicrobiales bacterium]
RSYFNAHDRTGDLFLVTGFGVYPNLGVTDAFATVRRGDRQVSVHFSDALGEDRLHPSVGPYRIEVLEPLERVRVVCDAPGHGLSFDLTWTGSFPVLDEPAHVMRQAGRVILDACRFAQVGTWSGTLQVDDEEWAVSDDRWVGSRDRSWGIRPIGEAEPAGRAAAEPDPDFGFWWMYTPMRFDDFGLVLIAQEDAHGHRILNEAVRVFPAGSGRLPEQLGWPRFDVRYRPGTRDPVGATVHLTEPDGTPLVVEFDTMGDGQGFVALNCGSGYGGDPDWGHGQWRGRGFSERHEVDLTDPAVAGRIPFGVIDHVGRARIGDAEGWGLFEHGTIGLHHPSGFHDFFAVAP